MRGGVNWALAWSIEWWWVEIVLRDERQLTPTTGINTLALTASSRRHPRAPAYRHFIQVAAGGQARDTACSCRTPRLPFWRSALLLGHALALRLHLRRTRARHGLSGSDFPPFQARLRVFASLSFAERASGERRRPPGLKPHVLNDIVLHTSGGRRRKYRSGESGAALLPVVLLWRPTRDPICSATLRRSPGVPGRSPEQTLHPKQEIPAAD